jgi:hypothetical protein
VITPPADITLEATALKTPVTLGAATATDTVDGALSPAPDQTGPGDDAYRIDNPGDQALEQASEGIDAVQSEISHTLVDAMASYGPPVNGVVSLTPAQQQAIKAAIDAAWQ